MKKIDMRFDAYFIHSWIGKEFKKYKCDAFDFTNTNDQQKDAITMYTH